MKKYHQSFSALFTAVIVAASSMLASCGGSDSSDSPPVTGPVETSIAYQQGDLLATDARLQKMTASLGTTSGALFQAIFAVNSFVFTDPRATDYATYLQRHADANQALDALNFYAGKTEENADALPISETGLKSLKIPQGASNFSKAAASREAALLTAAAASPEEVLAVLESSKSVWPIKTLMQQYQVSAKKAQLILNNAMAGITSQAYLDEAMLETQAITRLVLVKEVAGLTVTVGSTVLTMGAATGVMTGLEVGSIIGTAVISNTDAVIKVTKAGAELAIGRDGALDSAFDKSTLLSTIANVNELVSVKGLFTKSENWLDATSKITWVGGKLSEVFQEKKVSFGAESITLAELSPNFKANYLARIKALKLPTTFPGTYIDADKQQVTVTQTDMPQVVLEALDVLPVEAQLAIVQQMLPDSPDSPDVPGQFDGTYTGLAVTTWVAENWECGAFYRMEVTVLGSVLGEDLVGTVKGNVVTGTDTFRNSAFSGVITGRTMSGTWIESDYAACGGTFSLSRQ